MPHGAKLFGSFSKKLIIWILLFLNRYRYQTCHNSLISNRDAICGLQKPQFIVIKSAERRDRTQDVRKYQTQNICKLNSIKKMYSEQSFYSLISNRDAICGLLAKCYKNHDSMHNCALRNAYIRALLYQQQDHVLPEKWMSNFFFRKREF